MEDGISFNNKGILVSGGGKRVWEVDESLVTGNQLRNWISEDIRPQKETVLEQNSGLKAARVDLHGRFWKSTAVNPASSTHLASSQECNTSFLTMHDMDQESERCHLDALAYHLKTPVTAIVRATRESDQPDVVEEGQGGGWAVALLQW